jgi:hypothetical protein
MGSAASRRDTSSATYTHREAAAAGEQPAELPRKGLEPAEHEGERPQQLGDRRAQLDALVHLPTSNEQVQRAAGRPLQAARPAPQDNPEASAPGPQPSPGASSPSKVPIHVGAAGARVEQLAFEHELAMLELRGFIHWEKDDRAALTQKARQYTDELARRPAGRERRRPAHRGRM